VGSAFPFLFPACHPACPGLVGERSEVSAFPFLFLDCHPERSEGSAFLFFSFLFFSFLFFSFLPFPASPFFLVGAAFRGGPSLLFGSRNQGNQGTGTCEEIGAADGVVLCRLQA
jgi:hypothetical protein